jgi:MraZ protein
VDQKGLRGSSVTRIDEKGIYPMPVWLETERKLSLMPGNHPARLKFLDRVSYFGQTGELDGQGRVVISPHLREAASIVGDVRVLGRIDYLEVWNEERFLQKMQREVWTDEDGLRLSEHGI